MNAPKFDISTRADIVNLVHAFYEKAIIDEVIGVFFTEVVVLDFDTHLPKIINFWTAMLLDDHSYKGNPMIKHIELSRKKSLNTDHFERWISLWDNTIDHFHEGPLASEAKTRASQIGGLMMHKIRIDQTLNNDSNQFE